MRLPTLAALILTCLSACSLDPIRTAPLIRSDHPFLGRWTWSYKGCTETYDHRRDGTASVTSGEEVGASKYTISDQPEQSGYYRLVDTVTQSNGKTGCDGTPGGTPIGDRAVLFVRFLPSGNEMLICNTASLDECVGPLWRVY